MFREEHVDISLPQLTGDLPLDVTRYLNRCGHGAAVHHAASVAETAAALAARFGVPPEPARIAGWLHDISIVISVSERCQAAQRWDIAILPEEAALPMILHQKLSAWMAQHLFHITALDVLDAIRCHTTLRAHATPLDKVVFVADKIAWDQAGVPPYLPGLKAALQRSLSAGAFAYLAYLWDRRATLPVVHPWMCEAYRDLVGTGVGVSEGQQHGVDDAA
jgi:predicted HD superfamily hydrolase involved in NAD metabolism